MHNVENTPGMYSLSSSLKDRIKNPKDGKVEIRLDEVNQMREAIIDMSSPVGSRRNKSVESANRHGVYQLLTGAAKKVGRIPIVGKPFETLITRTTDTIVDSIYERYDPTMREHPWEGYGGPGKEGEINIRVREPSRDEGV